MLWASVVGVGCGQVGGANTPGALAVATGSWALEMQANTWLWSSDAAQRFGNLQVHTQQGHAYLWATPTPAQPDIPYTDVRLVAACFVPQ